MPELNKIEKNQFQIWIPLLLAVMAAVGMLIGFKMAGASPGSLISKSGDGKFGSGRVEEVIRYIESKYVDEIDSEELVEEAVRSIFEKLDPHSLYLSPDMVKRTNEEMNGSFNGLGIESILIDDTLNIYNVLKESPAFNAGLKPGDKVIQIGDSVIVNQGLEFDEIRTLMQKENGEIVSLKVISIGSSDMVTKNVEIGPVALHSVDIAYMINDKTGYILIRRFSSTTYKEFMLELEDMVENKNLENLIIDVRQNPGGYLPQATDILSQLFPQKGNLLVYTEGKDERLTEYKSTGKSFFPINKIAVLTDGGSASGSEILAGAIQDWDRGTIIGRRTFGKGLVQEQYNLSNGGAIRLTIARYFTPSGRLIQKSYEDLNDYRQEHSSRLDSGELTDENKMVINDTTKYFTLTEKRVVYGGGGITPDIFVPADKVLYDPEFQNIISHVSEYVYLKYRDGYFGNAEEFKFTTENKKELGDLFYEFVQEKNSGNISGFFANWDDKINHHIQAGVVNQLRGEEEMIKLLNNEDLDVIKAVEFIEN